MLTVLINPPSPFLTDERTLMPLGLLYLGAVLEAKGHKVRIIDLAGKEDYVSYMVHELEALKAELTGVGISITSSHAKIARVLAHEIRTCFPGMTIVAGGPHVTHTFQASSRQPQRTRQLISELISSYDVLVIGDAERAIEKALQGRTPKLLDACAARSPYYVDSDYLENAPFPARHLLDVSSYKYNLGHMLISGKQGINIMSQRGCPYRCSFCAGRMETYGRTCRRVSPQKIRAEILHLYENYRYTDFTFYDDELNGGQELGTLLNCLKDLQERVGREFRFRCFLRADCATQAQMKELAATGFKVIAIGAESGSNRILRNMGKRVTKDQNSRVIEWASNSGMYTKCIVSLGHPGESAETLQETDKWLEQVGIDDVNFTIVSALPCSEYYDKAVFRDGVWVYTCSQGGDRLYDTGVDWTETTHFFNGDPSVRYQPTIYTDYISQDELVKWHKYFELRYKSRSPAWSRNGAIDRKATLQDHPSNLAKRSPQRTSGIETHARVGTVRHSPPEG